MKTFDILSSPAERATRKTWLGGLITIVSIFLMVIFLHNEYSNFSEKRVTKTIYVDNKTKEDKIDFNLSIKLRYAPCPLISVDMEDALGNHKEDIDLFKVIIDQTGNTIEVVI